MNEVAVQKTHKLINHLESFDELSYLDQLDAYAALHDTRHPPYARVMLYILNSIFSISNSDARTLPLCECYQLLMGDEAFRELCEDHEVSFEEIKNWCGTGRPLD